MLSGELTRNILSEAAIIGRSSLLFGEVSRMMKSYLERYFWRSCFSLKGSISLWYSREEGMMSIPWAS